MVELFGLVLISFLVTSLTLVPFIDFLYYLKRNYKRKFTGKNLDTPIHNQLLQGKDVDTPVGGGIIVLVVTIFLSLGVLLATKSLSSEIFILILTMVLFGFIGFIDDANKILSSFSGKFRGMRGRYIFLMQVGASLVISYLLYYHLGLNNIFIPIFGNIILGIWYIPLAVFSMVSFANAYNISDGLDGLASGLLLICLFAFLVLASEVFNDTYALNVFIGIWIGALIAYLYFNIFPARIYLGDAGAYGFGATLAVVGLLTGKIIGLGVIGGVYVMIVGSSLIQIFGKKILRRKVFPIAPVHMYFRYIGWEEPKIVMRFWLVGAIFAILGLWLALISK